MGAPTPPEQKQAVADIVAGPRGHLVGPFIPLMRSPEFMNRLQRTGEYLRFNSAFEPRLSELAILITARAWTQNFEWHHHRPIAEKAGLEAAIIDAIAEGRRPDGMAADEAVMYDFLDELIRNRTVSEPTYRRTAQAFGEKGVIDAEVKVVGGFKGRTTSRANRKAVLLASKMAAAVTGGSDAHGP